MKQFQNKQTDIGYTDESKVTSKMTYADLCKYVLNQLVEGIKTVEMRKNIRVLDVIEKAIAEKLEIIELEDADFTHLHERVKKMVWTFQNKAILTFEDDIEAASKETKSE